MTIVLVLFKNAPQQFILRRDSLNRPNDELIEKRLQMKQQQREQKNEDSIQEL